MNHKAVSPLIASVLLVSITLTLIYFVSNWSTMFTTRGAGIIQQRGDTEMQCSSAALAIDNASYNCTSGKLMFETYNSGSKDLTDLKISMLLTNGSSYMLNAEPNATLYSGDTQIIYNSSANVSFSLIDRIIVRASNCAKTAKSELEGAKLTAYGC